MSGVISKYYLQHEIMAPVNLPETLLSSGTWLVVASFQIGSSESLAYNWAQLRVSDVGSAPHNIVGSNGLVSFGLYKDFDAGTHPRSQVPVEPVVYAGNSTTYTTVYGTRTTTNASYPATGSYQINQTLLFVLDEYTSTSSGNYSFVIANNTDDHDYHVTLSGLARLNQ